MKGIKQVLSVLIGILLLETNAWANDNGIKTVFWFDGEVSVMNKEQMKLEGGNPEAALKARWHLGREIAKKWGGFAHFSAQDKEVTGYLGPTYNIAPWAQGGIGVSFSPEGISLTKIGVFLYIYQKEFNALTGFLVVNKDGVSGDISIEITQRTSMGLTVRENTLLGPRVERLLSKSRWGDALRIRVWASPLFDWRKKGDFGVTMGIIISL